MKKGLIFLLLLFAFKSQCQNSDSLYIEDCYLAVLTNWPILKNDLLYQEITKLREKNIAKLYLPQLGINAQATYQSQVLELNLPIPGLKMPSLSKDQYKATVDVNQVFYDGGISKQKANIEKASLAVDQQQIKVDIQLVREKINELFFNTLILQENIKTLSLLINQFDDNIKVIQTCIQQGVLTDADLFAIQAEKLKTMEQLTEAEFSRKSLLAGLNQLTGLSIEGSAVLGVKPLTFKVEDLENRPEITLFTLQQQRLESSKELYVKNLMPKLYGFGQAGYGKPGLNMLSNSFDPYYLAGIKLSWAPWDWNQSRNERKIIDIQKNIIINQKEVFLKNTRLKSDQEELNFKKWDELIKNDREIIALREKISATGTAKLKGGIIKTNDLLEDMTKENQARIELDKHLAQREMAKYNYRLIHGN